MKEQWKRFEKQEVEGRGMTKKIDVYGDSNVYLII